MGEKRGEGRACNTTAPRSPLLFSCPVLFLFAAGRMDWGSLGRRRRPSRGPPHAPGGRRQPGRCRQGEGRRGVGGEGVA